MAGDRSKTPKTLTGIETVHGQVSGENSIVPKPPKPLQGLKHFSAQPWQGRSCSKTPKTLTGIETGQKALELMGFKSSKTPKTLTGIET